MAEYCPICEARIRIGSFNSGRHRCNPKRLRAIDAAHRRSDDGEAMDEPDAREKLAEWSEMLSSYDDDREDDR